MHLLHEYPNFSKNNCIYLQLCRRGCCCTLSSSVHLFRLFRVLCSPVPRPADPALSRLFLHLHPRPVNTQPCFTCLGKMSQNVRPWPRDNTESTHTALLMWENQLGYKYYELWLWLWRECECVLGKTRSLKACDGDSDVVGWGWCKCYLHLSLLSGQGDVKNIQCLLRPLQDRIKSQLLAAHGHCCQTHQLLNVHH